MTRLFDLINLRRTIAIASLYGDPLHPGHIRYLAAARKLADRLVVIVNNDKQAVLKKGRSFMHEQDRCEMVASIRHVDAVVLSIDEDPSVSRTLERILLLYPDDRYLFCNGGDVCEVSQVREAATCIKYEVRMVFGVGGSKIQSSSHLLEQAKKQ